MEDDWYVATLVMQSRIVGHDKRLKLIDEQIRVLRAPGIEAAYEKAVQLGRREETSYENVYGETVYWKFVGLADLETLPFDEDIKDGTEIKSRFLRKKDPAKLVCSKANLTVFRWEREARERRLREARVLEKQHHEP